jgi:hypothetical protein
VAAAAWESSGDSSIIRIIFQKEDSARIAGLSLKDGLYRDSIVKLNFKGNNSNKFKYVSQMAESQAVSIVYRIM